MRGLNQKDNYVSITQQIKNCSLHLICSAEKQWWAYFRKYTYEKNIFWTKSLGAGIQILKQHLGWLQKC